MQECEIKGIVRTITDGVKDAGMQCGYAETARDAGNAQLAKLHIEEAARRLDGVSEWYKKAAELAKLPDGESPAFRCLWDDYAARFREMRARVSEFRA